MTERTYAAYVKSDEAGGGTRARLAVFTIACVDGNATPSATYWTAPALEGPPVDGPTGEGGEPGSGGAQVNDQWSPSVTFLRDSGGVERVLVTYMSTQSDPNNIMTGLYGYYSEDGGFSMSSAFTLSQGPPATFDVRDGDTWDYNLIGAHSSGRFLATWGGDARSGGNDVWSCVVQ